MTFCIITHVIHTAREDKFYAYAPYVNEMNIWLEHVDKTIVVAPLGNFEINSIHSGYQKQGVKLLKISKFDFLNFSNTLKSIIKIPGIAYRIFQAMRSSDHIHLRCPGNVGLIGCFVQILFPGKIKTAKYAGNWDKKSKQPLSYRLQRWILSNTFLTRNMSVLVYGEWGNQTQNVRPFFTATYRKDEIVEVDSKEPDRTVRFVFVGSLTEGKHPLYAVKLVRELKNKGYDAALSLYGDGAEKQNLINYISNYNLSNFITIHGNIGREALKEVYRDAHFLLLPSNSEGWPKVVAEAMFWGCLPVATQVSCVPNMLDKGNRGVLLDLQISSDVEKIIAVITDRNRYAEKVANAMAWSRQFTVDYFENEIKMLLKV